MRAQWAEDAAKLDSVLAEIEALKREVHESHCEVTSLTKKLETSNNHQSLIVEALEKANLELAGLRDSNEFYEGKIKYYVEDAEKAQLAREEAVKDYVVIFHLV